jgi:hypothetical protein
MPDARLGKRLGLAEERAPALAAGGSPSNRTSDPTWAPRQTTPLLAQRGVNFSDRQLRQSRRRGVGAGFVVVCYSRAIDHTKSKSAPSDSSTTHPCRDSNRLEIVGTPHKRVLKVSVRASNSRVPVQREGAENESAAGGMDRTREARRRSGGARRLRTPLLHQARARAPQDGGEHASGAAASARPRRA